MTSNSCKMNQQHIHVITFYFSLTSVVPSATLYIIYLQLSKLIQLVILSWSTLTLQFSASSCDTDHRDFHKKPVHVSQILLLVSDLPFLSLLFCFLTGKKKKNPEVITVIRRSLEVKNLVLIPLRKRSPTNSFYFDRDHNKQQPEVLYGEKNRLQRLKHVPVECIM